MNYSISVERIVRALNMCKCTEIVNGIIHVIKDDSYKRYITKTSDQNKIEYISKQLYDNVEETVEDFKLILKEFDSSICTSLLNKGEFEKFLNNIKFKK